MNKTTLFWLQLVGIALGVCLTSALRHHSQMPTASNQQSYNPTMYDSMSFKYK